MDKNQETGNSLLIELLDLIRIVLICFVCVFICTRFFFKPVKVEGASMYPTLKDSEYGFSNVFSALCNDFSRFDVVVVSSEVTGNENWVKRIIALPGETIEYKEDKLYIDGSYIEEPFLNEEYKNKTKGEGYFTNDFGPIKLKNNEYFLMGDNRPVSHDSRAVGAFHGDDINSKSVLVLFPFNEIGLVNSGNK